MSTERTQDQPAERETPARRTVPVRLARRTSVALEAMKSRAIPDDGVSRLDVSAFNSSI